MYHSIIFGDKNTWADWYLFPSSRPVINPPKPKTKYIDIPGADWQLDLSTVLLGDIAYSAREGSIEFIVDNGQLSAYKAETWADLYSEILDFLHGKYMKMVLEDDPGFYYEGRFTLNSWKSEEHNSKITIDYNLRPFKIENTSSLEDWLWDPFSFEHGIIREYKDLRVDGERTLIIAARRMMVIPMFIVESDDGKGLTVEFNGAIHSLPDGESRVLNIQTREGENTLTFKGNGTVSVDYRGGCL